MSDNRVDKVRAVWPDDDIDYVPMHLRVIESAGLLVVDPTDPAVIDRVARSIAKSATRTDTAWDLFGESSRQAYRRDAGAALAALSGDQR